MSEAQNPLSTVAPTGKMDTDEVRRQLAAGEPRFRPGDTVPGLSSWVLERKLGSGGFGEVWLTRHEWKDDRRAVKFCTDPVARHRLVIHEKKVVVRVMKHTGGHPNIVPLLECNLDGETPWLMYEFVEGGTLADTIHQWHALPVAERLQRAFHTLHTLAGALGQFHRFDPPIIHRDLKPQNVLMAGSVPRITDFGIGGAAVETSPDAGALSDGSVRLPSLLRVSGTGRYASPEQLHGSPPNTRDDVYALGVIAYQMAFADLKVAPGADAADELRDLGAPDAFLSLVVKSVSNKPERRPKDGREWEQIIATCLAAAPVGPVRTTPFSASHALTASAAVRNEGPAGAAPESVSDSTVTHAAVAVALRKLVVSVPGAWYSAVGDTNAKWVKVAQTPAEVETFENEVYFLSASSAVCDRDLEGLTALDGVSGVEHLDLAHCAQVTDVGVGYAAAVTSLRYLDLSQCPELTNAAVARLAPLANLRHLGLSGCWRLTDAALADLHPLAALTYLNVASCPRLTDASLVHLAKLPALRHLDLSQCTSITNAGVVHLTALSSLQHLNLHGCWRVTDSGLAQLAGVGSKKSRWATTALKDGSALLHLTLRRCTQITDVGLGHLKALHQLQSLDLRGCPQLTDVGLAHLKALPNLLHLELGGCEQLSDAAVNSLQAALPKCQIDR